MKLGRGAVLLRILIVDDHEVIRKSVRNMLAAHSDWEVCGEAEDGVEAVEKARALQPDVILMDVAMPRMDGVQATKAILREMPDADVIIVSQNDPVILSKQAAESRASAHLAKGTMSRDLMPTIERVVANRNGQRILNIDFWEQKLAEGATDLLAAIVDSSDDAIISKSLEGIITSWNKGAERLFGHTREEAVGRHITLIIPEDRREEEVGILQRLKRGERIDHIETIRKRKDGALLELSVTISPVKDNTGRIVGASKVARDITNAKRIERELRDSEDRLRRLSDNLELEVRARTRELEHRNTEILQQSRQLRELSNRLLKTQEDERRHIARELHDSAGQLVAALGMNIAGIMEYAKADPDLGKIAKDTDHLVQQLGKEIRTTSYLLHPPLLDENGLPQAIRWYMQGLKERSGLAVELDIPEDFGRLPADLEMSVFRIVQECLTNIHRHSGSKTAAIHLSRDADRVVLEIQDHGSGISPEKLAAIRAQRTGVGITGMIERVRHFHGEMDIQSSEAGAIVSVTLPVREIPANGVEGRLSVA